MHCYAWERGRLVFLREQEMLKPRKQSAMVGLEADVEE